MQEAMKTINEVQGTGAKAQGQLNDFTRMLGELQSKLPSTFTPQQQ